MEVYDGAKEKPSGEKQHTLDFESIEKIDLAVAIAKELGDNLRWWLLRNVALPDGVTDRGKRVSGEVLSRYLRALHIYPVPCWASANTLAKKSEEGSQPALSEKSMDNAVQALRRPLGPNRFGGDPFEPLLQETPHKRGTTNKYILWQYLTAYLPPSLRSVFEKKRGIADAATRELSSPVELPTREPGSPSPGNSVPASREPGSHESVLESGAVSVGNDDGDDDANFDLREKANRFDAAIGGCRGAGLRERVLRVCRLWQRGDLPLLVCEDVLRELEQMRRTAGIKRPRSLLFTLFLNRGYDLDRMIVTVPAELVAGPKRPPAADASK